MRIGALTVSEVGVVAWAIVPSIAILALVVYLVLLARRHVHAQERIAAALERERGGGPGAPR